MISNEDDDRIEIEVYCTNTKGFVTRFCTSHNGRYRPAKYATSSRYKLEPYQAPARTSSGLFAVNYSGLIGPRHHLTKAVNAGAYTCLDQALRLMMLVWLLRIILGDVVTTKFLVNVS